MGKTRYLSESFSLRAASLPKLDNMVNNNNSIFNTRYAEFSTRW